MCTGGPGEKHLQTQFINKSLPAPDTYPVRIYIDITYSFTECPKHGCDVELHIVNHSKSFSFGENIMPDNYINSTNETSNGTKIFNFSSSTLSTGFNLTLISGEGCVTVSRVLVYRYECPGHDRQPTVDLGRRPATQAPVRGFEPVTSYCAENSNFTGRRATRMLMCSSSGDWSGAPLPCQCDVGYSRNGNICEGKKNNVRASQFHNCVYIFLAEGQVSSDVTQLSAASSFTVSPDVTQLSAASSFTVSPDVTQLSATTSSFTVSPDVTQLSATTSSITVSPDVTQLSAASSFTVSPDVTQLSATTSSFTVSPDVTQLSATTSSITVSPDVTQLSATTSSFTVSPDVTQLSATTSSFTVSPSVLPSPQSTDGTTENPTVRERNTAAEGSSGGPPITILAGVAAVIVVFLFLFVIVALIIAVVRKKRKLKPNERLA